MAQKKPLKKLGRPTKAEGPRLPHDEVDRLLVEGEEVPTTRGRVKRRFPSLRELAERFGVAHSAVARYAQQHDCLGRRKRLLAGQPPDETPAPDDAPAPAEAPPPPPKRKSGRPRKSEEPALPRQELDRALVFGDVKTLPDGSTMTSYASYRELAERFGVATSLVANYAKEHNCLRRREEAKTRIATKADQKLIELRANAIAVSKDDALKMIDGYLLGFEEALAEGRVRVDNPTDFNTMVRLKEFVQGGADSRQELHASFSLEGLQSRHAQALRAARETSPAERGEVDAEVVESDDEGPDTASSERPRNAAVVAPPTDVAPPPTPTESALR
ncbi:AT hook motif domain protein [Myxococcus llanfairpwllgwyngyllgogerychwyrndrobwllllantysiliogogogochensis]|uniref:AT hook motif domain protein n=1 Tax=Myxococcus llanfairpwllgwyngyllgogerychwyrndrobwllllantysiliogogogochensis TaxID=2590453 RepID=A0A540WIV2_9BACT|nr:AT hook motif domain protein [Myxococcus llanfairpwllgwyngyllgogerychwyrndrobwllllantysiliogogogochensis]TQF08913.1 AT hook motif domain protein [Myxococcus llanfairpwllgwyngyllgogerychwyrndrobwllllantysiliogogogochensis]